MHQDAEEQLGYEIPLQNIMVCLVMCFQYQELFGRPTAHMSMLMGAVLTMKPGIRSGEHPFTKAVQAASVAFEHTS
jgi:hypothetical protein